MSLTVLPSLMAGPMLAVGFMSAGCSLLKQAETNYAFTQFTFTMMTPSSLSLEPIGCFGPCAFGIKSQLIGGFARLLLESDKWARPVCLLARIQLLPSHGYCRRGP
jgi:hypothetical protein